MLATVLYVAKRICNLIWHFSERGVGSDHWCGINHSFTLQQNRQKLGGEFRIRYVLDPAKILHPLNVSSSVFLCLPDFIPLFIPISPSLILFFFSASSIIKSAIAKTVQTSIPSDTMRAVPSNMLIQSIDPSKQTKTSQCRIQKSGYIH